jgi:hypothetical protein
MPGKGFNDGKNIIPQQRLPSRNTYLVYPKLMERFRKYPVFGEGQFSAAGIVPAVTHFTTAVTAIGSIKFGQIWPCQWSVTSVSSGDNILLCPPQGSHKAPRENNVTIGPEVVEPHGYSLSLKL